MIYVGKVQESQSLWLGGPSEFSLPNGKSAMRSVGAAGYNENVLPKLITDGDNLFAGNRTLARTWIFQQDYAPAHIARMNEELLNAYLPDSWIQDWPACSCDLRWLENLWAWAEHQQDPLRESIWSASDPICQNLRACWKADGVMLLLSSFSAECWT